MNPQTQELEELGRELRQANEQLDAVKKRLSEFEDRFQLQPTYKSRDRGVFPFYYAPFNEQFPFVDFLNSVRSAVDKRLSQLADEAKGQGGITTGRFIYQSDLAKIQELDQQVADVLGGFLDHLESKFLHDLEQDLRETKDKLEAVWLGKAELQARGTHGMLMAWEAIKKEVLEANDRAREATRAFDEAVSETQKAARQSKREELLGYYGTTITRSGLLELLEGHAHSVEYYVSLLDIPMQGQGVYLLWHDADLEYVGRTISRSVRDRLRSHDHYREGQDYLIGVVFVDEDDKRERLETTLIRTLSPKRNIKDRIPEGQEKLPI